MAIDIVAWGAITFGFVAVIHILAFGLAFLLKTDKVCIRASPRRR